MFKINNILRIFISLLILSILFQNCQNRNKYNLSLINSDSNTIESNNPVSFNGNGGIYDGKLERYDFILGTNGVTPQILMPQGGISLDRELPKGLFFDASNAIVYGIPIEVTNGYWLYGILNQDGVLIKQFLIGVGNVYYVNAPLDKMYQPDIDISDGVCKTIDGFCSLRSAMEQSNNNNVKTRVYLPEGRFYLGSYPIEVRQRLEIFGAGSDKTILDGEGKVQIINVIADDFEINGVQLVNGYISHIPTETEKLVSNWEKNSKYNGACLSMSNSNIEFTAEQLIKKYLSYRIKNSSFTNCVLHGPFKGGGAVFTSGNIFIVEDSTFQNNFADVIPFWSGGGAIFIDLIYRSSNVENSSFVSIRNSDFINNYSSSNAGAIYNNVNIGVSEISNSQFISNQALNGDGGAIQFYKSSDTNINSTIFRGNISKGTFNFGAGGAISWIPSSFSNSLNIDNSLFELNKSDTRGSAIGMDPNRCSSLFEASQISINNSIISQNTSLTNQGAIHIPPYCDVIFSSSKILSNVGKNCFISSISDSSTNVTVYGNLILKEDVEVDSDDCLTR